MTQAQAERAAKGDSTPLWVMHVTVFPADGSKSYAAAKPMGPYTSLESANRAKARIEKRIPGKDTRNGFVERA